ncbi:MAG TPA: MogA/MoaB family molybdenum cofactor biosynthesis protein [Polyangia bacterium]|jgi:molybdenum cofactor biosynthesis protein B|nr:MogA/MoaB family molybdenum cofactor biosynthesis protein [Polyangia bacterium]
MAESAASGHHKAMAPPASSIRVALVTASDSRTPATNEGGHLLRRLVEEAGFVVVEEALLVEEPTAMRERVVSLVSAAVADAVLITGGTGLAPRDRTPEAITPLFERRLPGFGELFRLLSFQQIGAAAMLSRAEAGVVGGVPVFLLPGSPAAIELAVRALIVPELPHLIGQLRRAH